MSKIHELPDIERVEREASDWIVRLHAEDVTAEDRAGFAAWRQAHVRHERAYEQLARTWQEFREAGPIVRAVAFGNAMNAAAHPRWRVRWPAIAAAAGLVAILSSIWLWRAPAREFQTAIGEQVTVRLPDGSSVQLNSDSLAKVEYTASVRVVRLRRGEAFFKVARDARRPFSVAAGDSWVLAVGTAFNVRYVNVSGRSNEVRVTVSEGEVKVSPESKESDLPRHVALEQVGVSKLSAGEQAELQGGVATVRVLPPVELTRSLAWRQGTLDFDNQPLGAVVDELGRYSPVRIVIEDEKLRQIPIGGAFQANPHGVEALISMLQQGFSLKVRRGEAGRVYIEDEAGNEKSDR